MRFSQCIHAQNCDIQQGDPMANRPVKCICKTEKIKNPARAQAFFELFFDFFSRLGKILLLACFLAVFEGKDGLSWRFQKSIGKPSETAS